VNGSRRTAGSQLDWKAIRDRLALATKATERDARPGPAEAKRVLDERARHLARPPAPEQAPGELLVLATFALGSERYGIETGFVREIARFLDFTPVPGAGDFLVGVTNLRGEILAVINLRRFFGVSDQGVTDLSRVVVLGRDRNEFGILADQVHDIAAVRDDEVLEPPASAPGAGRPYVRGVTKDALIVLAGARLLGDQRLYIDQSQDIALAQWPNEEG
jgi:purine-binding chemotaxis protein CheW